MKIAFLTAGGIAPCLSASIGRLIRNYSNLGIDVVMIGYMHGYKGLLRGDVISIGQDVINHAEILYEYGGSPIGNSRVKLTNIEDCISNSYINKDENPLEVAANQLIKDNVTILHTIGGDDTNTSAGELVNFLEEKKYDLTVVGLPKTVDNDVYPITQTLGAWTAAEQSAIYFENISNENTTSTRQLIIHEIMGRNCGWLTANTAREYRAKLQCKDFLDPILISKERWDIDAVFIPEIKLNLEIEIPRLRQRMDEKDCINIFLSEGAGLNNILDDIEKNNQEIKRDAFGHVRLDEINPGKWFAKQLSKGLNAEKVLVQKSGYFARSAKPNKKDLDLIFKTADLATKSAINGISGVIGLDEQNNDELTCINFNRIKGGKPFNYKVDWFESMLKEID